MIKVLLVDDQPLIAEAIKRMLLPIQGVEFSYCQAPQKILDAVMHFSPTVILQDLVMPGIEGMALVRHLKAHPGTRDIPLVVLSAKEEAATKAAAFAAGANDYMVKLPEEAELQARILYHSKTYSELKKRNLAFQKLEASQEKIEQELAEAAGYVKMLLPPPSNEKVRVAWEFIPSEQLGGDAFGYHWIDERYFALYLLDVCGHGVGAALLSVSIINVLRSHALQINYKDPSEVLAALNEAFPMEQHHEMFFTMWYGVYDKQTGTLVYGSGGHPPALLFSGDKETSLKTEGFLVGGKPHAKFEKAAIQVKEKDQLFIFSDGTYEIRQANGEMMTLETLKGIIHSSLSSKEESLHQIVREVSKKNGGKPFNDDFSILHVTF